MHRYNYTLSLHDALPILRKLGKLDWIYCGVNANTTYELGLFYRAGIIAFVGIQQVYKDGKYSVCLNDKPYNVEIVLLDSYANRNESDLSPVQQKWGLPKEPAPY